MSRTRFAFALPFVLAAVPALAQPYYPAPQQAPQPQPAPPQQQAYDDDPRYAPTAPRYADAPAYPRRDPYYPAPAYQRPPQPAYGRPYPPQAYQQQAYQQSYGYAQPYPRRAPAYQPADDQGDRGYADARSDPRPAPDPRQAYPRDDRGQLYASVPAYQRPAPATGYADRPAAAAVEAPVQHGAPDRLEQMMWQAAAQADSLAGYGTYLNRYPGGDHAREAEASIDRLRRMPPQAPRPIEPAPIVESAAIDAPAAVAAPAATAPAAIAAAAPAAVEAPALPGGKPLPMVAVATAPVPVAPAETVDAAPAAVAAAAPATPAATAVAANAAVAGGPAPAPMLVASSSPVAATPAAATGGVVPAELPPAVCRPAFASDVPYDQAGEAEISAYLHANQLNSLAAYQAYLQAYPRGVFAPEVAELVAARQGRMAAIARLEGAGPAAAHARAALSPSDRDYPSAALRDGQEGRATAIWEVAEDGCVEQCRIDRSSGSASLDAATCRTITARGRYDPARNAEGKPIRSLDSTTLAWKLPTH